MPAMHIVSAQLDNIVILETAIFLDVYVLTASCGKRYCNHVKKML